MSNFYMLTMFECIYKSCGQLRWMHTLFPNGETRGNFILCWTQVCALHVMAVWQQLAAWPTHRETDQPSSLKSCHMYIELHVRVHIDFTTPTKTVNNCRKQVPCMCNMPVQLILIWTCKTLRRTMQIKHAHFYTWRYSAWWHYYPFTPSIAMPFIVVI